MTALFNYWPELEKHGIVKATRKFGKTKLYTLNSENGIVKRLIDLELELIKNSVDTQHNLKVQKIKQLA